MRETLKDKIEYFLIYVFYPLFWLMENENTKKGKIVLLLVQIIVSVVTTIIMWNYFLK